MSREASPFDVLAGRYKAIASVGADVNQDGIDDALQIAQNAANKARDADGDGRDDATNEALFYVDMTPKPPKQVWTAPAPSAPAPAPVSVTETVVQAPSLFDTIKANPLIAIAGVAGLALLYKGLTSR